MPLQQDTDELGGGLADFINKAAAKAMPPPAMFIVLNGSQQTSTGYVYGTVEGRRARCFVGHPWDLTGATGSPTFVLWAVPERGREGVSEYIAIAFAWNGLDNNRLPRLLAVEYATTGGGGDTGLGTAYILIREEQAQNTAGGTFTSGAWRTRVLNTEVTDTGNNASISSNQITLASGTYRAHILVPAYFVDQHQARLYNASDGAVVLLGTSEYSPSSGAGWVTPSVIVGRFTLASSKVLEVQHQCAVTQATNGFGKAANFTTEIYTVVQLEREN